ncbi:hypothetical protein UFOVP621_116 [uncultured Caudovirales phage]|uniref:Uncharacterized protein n=1 Tax=uncultured Caudovirales phage TaxID=2100421 RepID=A0A6J5N8C8_9CAUD|nr:hypothetical protein UFOVP621_116 [uncultured Caudovirales phage]
MNSADSRYNRRPWNEDNRGPRYDYMGPYSDKQEQLTSQALAANTVPGEFLADIVRPPLPQIQLFRSRFGYRTRELSISDIMDVDDIYAEPRTELGGAAGFSGTSRNTSGNAAW